MKDLGPFSPIEQLFIESAEQRLPVGEAQIARNEHGILSYLWPSPCDEVEGLYAIIQEGEISLSTKISHTHINHLEFLPASRSEVEDRDIVEKGIAAVECILAGEATFSRSYDVDGREHSTGFGHLSTMADEIAEYREIFGDGITRRTWNWFGEVTSNSTSR